MRDLIAYLLVVVIIVAVAYDGIVSQTSSTVFCFIILHSGLLAGGLSFSSAVFCLLSICNHS